MNTLLHVPADFNENAIAAIAVLTVLLLLLAIGGWATERLFR